MNGAIGLTGAAAALGIGMLIGLELQRHKGQGETRACAGLRTFAIKALLGQRRAPLRRLLDSGPGVADPGVEDGNGAVLMDIARATDKNQVGGTRSNQSVVLLLD